MEKNVKAIETSIQAMFNGKMEKKLELQVAKRFPVLGRIVIRQFVKCSQCCKPKHPNLLQLAKEIVPFLAPLYNKDMSDILETLTSKQLEDFVKETTDIAFKIDLGACIVRCYDGSDPVLERILHHIKQILVEIQINQDTQLADRIQEQTHHLYTAIQETGTVNTGLIDALQSFCQPEPSICALPRLHCPVLMQRDRERIIQVFYTASFEIDPQELMTFPSIIRACCRIAYVSPQSEYGWSILSSCIGILKHTPLDLVVSMRVVAESCAAEPKLGEIIDGFTYRMLRMLYIFPQRPDPAPIKVLVHWLRECQLISQALGHVQLYQLWDFVLSQSIKDESHDSAWLWSISELKNHPLTKEYCQIVVIHSTATHLRFVTSGGSDLMFRCTNESQFLRIAREIMTVELFSRTIQVSTTGLRTLLLLAECSCEKAIEITRSLEMYPSWCFVVAYLGRYGFSGTDKLRDEMTSRIQATQLSSFVSRIRSDWMEYDERIRQWLISMFSGNTTALAQLRGYDSADRSYALMTHTDDLVQTYINVASASSCQIATLRKMYASDEGKDVLSTLTDGLLAWHSRFNGTSAKGGPAHRQWSILWNHVTVVVDKAQLRNHLIPLPATLTIKDIAIRQYLTRSNVPDLQQFTKFLINAVIACPDKAQLQALAEYRNWMLDFVVQDQFRELLIESTQFRQLLHIAPAFHKMNWASIFDETLCTRLLTSKHGNIHDTVRRLLGLLPPQCFSRAFFLAASISQLLQQPKTNASLWLGSYKRIWNVKSTNYKIVSNSAGSPSSQQMLQCRRNTRLNQMEVSMLAVDPVDMTVSRQTHVCTVPLMKTVRGLPTDLPVAMYPCFDSWWTCMVTPHYKTHWEQAEWQLYINRVITDVYLPYEFQSNRVRLLAKWLRLETPRSRSTDFVFIRMAKHMFDEELISLWKTIGPFYTPEHFILLVRHFPEIWPRAMKFDTFRVDLCQIKLFCHQQVLPYVVVSILEDKKYDPSGLDHQIRSIVSDIDITALWLQIEAATGQNLKFIQ